jgi:alkylation response protein AidB-like acyl-CoA dehydrogenase
MKQGFVNRRDMEFQLLEVLDVESLTARPRFADHSRDTFLSALDTAIEVAAAKFAPHYRKADEEEPRIENGRVRLVPEVKEALDAYVQAGFLLAHRDADVGGMQLPATVARAVQAVFEAANVGTSSYVTLTSANANLIAAHGSPDQKRRYLAPLLAGRFFGTMALTEPQAGSSLADVRTLATPLPDGTYAMSGTKTFISGGEHELSENIVHLVLARTPDAPPGVKGISLFIVPKRRVNADGSVGEANDIALAGLFHKMGWRGTTSTQLAFGENGRCVGELVGERNKGLAYMFHMMNEARIGVGLAAVMLGYHSHLAAVEYARERPQGRPLTASGRDPKTPQIPIVEHADVRRMLLASKSYVEGGLALCLYAARLVDENHTAPSPEARGEASALLDLLTPVVKAWPAQYCLEASSLAIQVHGGYGYTREYPVEQLYRDNRLNAIHEGTNGIQALDLLGRKSVGDGGRALGLLERSVARDVEAASRFEALRPHCAPLQQALSRAGAAARAVAAALPRDPERALANAAYYLEAFGHVAVAWMWLRQATAAARALAAAPDRDVDFYQGKLAACRYFFACELPKTAHLFGLVESLDASAVEARPAWL